MVEKAGQKTQLIETQLELWVELKSLLPHLFRWVRGAVSELSCLRKVPDFATEFASLESRMDVSNTHIIYSFMHCGVYCA